MPVIALSRLRSVIGDRAILAIIVIAGVAVRFLWFAFIPTATASGEALNVAKAIAAGRGVADAYGAGTGPTAHFYPVTPGLGGMVYAIFGTQSQLSEFLLACWAIGLALAVYLIVMRTFSRLGTHKVALFAGLAFACIAPSYIGQEVVDFRLWDGALTACLLALLLDRLVVLDAAPDVRRDALAIGLLLASLLAIHAPSGLAGAAAVAWLAFWRLGLRQASTIIIVAAVWLTILITPWVIRNYQVFGAFVPSRSNAGLELAIGMDDGALHTSDRMSRFLSRLEELHPNHAAGYRAMAAAGGEVSYSKALMSQTEAWMVNHPTDTARLLLLHLRQQFIPEPWQFAVFGKSVLSPMLRTILASAVNLLGLAGIAVALVRRRPGWIYLMIVIGGLSMTTLPFQPMKRYNYLFYPFLIFAAADFLFALLTWRKRRRHEDSAADPAINGYHGPVGGALV